MAVPHVSTNFGDLLDPRFQRIFDEEYKQLPDMLPMLFTTVPQNGRNNIMWSQVGTVPDFNEFTGTVTYASQNQGYDTTATYVEFASGIQVERKLFDDDQFHVMDQKPRALAASAARTRQKHGARILVNAFSVDTFFYNNSEAVALCSNSHTTTSGASTANGFDNLTTAALSAVAVAAARIQMVGFRGDQAERISVVPDELWHPPDLYEEAYEIIQSSGKVDTANNNRNVHEGKYRSIEWNYLGGDTNNWFMVDSTLKRQMCFWIDRIGLEFAMIEDFDTLVAKWRAYMRYANAHVDWRWILGASVS
jgi:phage major head subunit gpT-like protein